MSSCWTLLNDLDLVEQVAPIQLGIRLLVTADRRCWTFRIRERVTPFEPASLTWPWRHDDRRVDALQAAVMRIVKSTGGATRGETFGAISALRTGTGGPADGPARPAHSPDTPVPLCQRALVLLRRADGDLLRWKKRVLLVATTTGYQIRSFGEAARSWGSGSCLRAIGAIGSKIPGGTRRFRFGFMMRPGPSKPSSRRAPTQSPDGIVAVGDRPAVLAARLARAFGLPGIRPMPLPISRNKLLRTSSASSGRTPDAVV